MTYEISFADAQDALDSVKPFTINNQCPLCGDIIADSADCCDDCFEGTYELGDRD